MTGLSFQGPRLRGESSCDRKAGGMWNEAGKCLPKGAGEETIWDVRLKAKNELVVSGNISIGHNLG